MADEAAQTPSEHTIVLDAPAADAGADPFAPAAETPPEQAAAAPEKPAEKKEGPDELVVNLIRRGSALKQKEKQLAAREAASKERDAIWATAKTDPLAFMQKAADAAGIDYEDFIAAYTAAKSGGEAKLPEGHEVKALKAEIEALKAELHGDKKTREEQEGDALVQGHLADLKTVAGKDAAAFPLFNAAAEENAAQAFDLMVAHHKAGRPIDHAKAVQLIEAVLREDAEKKAQLLGYSKPAPAAPAATPSARPTQPAATPQPRAVTASAAPFETATRILSDEEIRADWSRLTGGLA